MSRSRSTGASNENCKSEASDMPRFVAANASALFNEEKNDRFTFPR